MRLAHYKFSVFYACKKFFAQLVGKPNPGNQRQFTAHGLSFKSIRIKRI